MLSGRYGDTLWGHAMGTRCGDAQWGRFNIQEEYSLELEKQARFLSSADFKSSQSPQPADDTEAASGIRRKEHRQRLQPINTLGPRKRLVVREVCQSAFSGEMEPIGEREEKIYTQI
ncbi:hypothetical protein H8959_002892 [Pygathrix nigripes]